MTTATNSYNTALGAGAGEKVTTGIFNTFLGASSAANVTDCDGNTAIGFRAMQTNQLGDGQVAIGNDSLYSSNYSTATAAYNVGVGHSAGYSISTGVYNTCIGSRSGATSTPITTGSYNIMIGVDGRPSAGNGGFQICIGHAVTGTGDNTFNFGKVSNVVSNDFSSNASFSRSSDVHKKTNIEDDTLGLDFINDLRTVTYNWKPQSEFPKHYKDYHPTENNMKTDIKLHGMVAQEVKAALDKAGVDTFGGWSEEEDGSQRISQEMFIHPLIRAVQELSNEVKQLKEKLNG